jgi:predicted phosphodiesterase
MRLAVISDLHLGTGGATDGFGHDDGDFLKFLRFLEKNFEKIVLLGDVWETLTGTVPGRAGEQLQKAREHHREIARRFAQPKYVYVHGNHDLVAGAIDGAPDELLLESDGVRLLFTHGHQNDSLVQRRRWVSELGVWIGGWVRRVGLRPLYRLLADLDERRGGLSREAAQRAFEFWAMSLASRRNVDVIVTGHTHFATRSDEGGRLFLNSGSCSEGNLSYLAIDTQRGCYGVHCSF